MLIDGYLDGFVPAVAADTLVDRTDLVHSPVFWSLFPNGIGGAASAGEAFDIDPADLNV